MKITKQARMNGVYLVWYPTVLVRFCLSNLYNVLEYVDSFIFEFKRFLCSLYCDIMQ